MDEGADLEILLVLCCLVSAIVFLCFSVGAVNLTSEIGVAGAGSEIASLSNERDTIVRDVADQEAKLATLKADIAARARQAARLPPGDPQDRVRTRRAVDTLRSQLDDLRRRIELAMTELGRHRQRADEAASQTAETTDLEELRRVLQASTAQLDVQRKMLSTLRPPSDDAPDKDLRALRQIGDELDREMKDLEARLAGLRDEPGTFAVKRQLSGSTKLLNPLIVECKRQGIVVHPEGQEIAVTDLVEKNPFAMPPGKPDGIVFLIRPDGFDVFHKSFELAEKTRLPIIYEGVDAHLKLRF